ncbi:MAG: hypothetical protein H7095_08300 [Pseudopedobacter sp.]|nr:hypothetical protein [Deinococcales bacterium]
MSRELNRVYSPLRKIQSFAGQPLGLFSPRSSWRKTMLKSAFSPFVFTLLALALTAPARASEFGRSGFSGGAALERGNSGSVSKQ